MQLVERLLAGEMRAVGRAISLVEEGGADAVSVLQGVYPRTGRARVVGLTGAPGAGKSSLTDRLVERLRADGRRVGVVAVDPSSAYSGGAILGDRIRMQRHSTDEGVFIRSMATRGHLGGLARASNDAIDVLDAAGYDTILVETVGVGQDEVDIVKTADVVVVMLVPGMGDDIQAIKAGILEIADLFVINKSDRPGADRLEADLDYMMSLAPDDKPRPRILRTVAVTGQGIDGLREGIEQFVESSGEGRRRARRRDRAEARFLALLGEQLLQRVRAEIFDAESYRELLTAMTDRRLDPYSAARGVLDRVEVR